MCEHCTDLVLRRPQKGKIYVQTLVPSIVKIAGKKEESIIETLADSIPKIFRHIGLFSADNDIKVKKVEEGISKIHRGDSIDVNLFAQVLLKVFLKNLSSDSVEIRRAAASSIAAICRYSRKPEYFFAHVLNTLLGMECVISVVAGAVWLCDFTYLYLFFFLRRFTM